jgi:hypothetical protein
MNDTTTTHVSETDPRVVEIANVTGDTPADVIETARQFAQANGDSVDEELSTGAAVAEMVEGMLAADQPADTADDGFDDADAE